jgi:site-specific DNA recombinase
MDKDKIAFYASLYVDKDFEVPIKEQFEICDSKLSWHDDELAGYYSDERTIASSNPRCGLMRMLRDAKDGKIDSILTTDIDRLALNDKNLVEIVRRLKSSGVEVYTSTDLDQPLSQLLAADIYAVEQEAIFQETMAWERYWDAQMELAESDYPQHHNQQAHPHQDLSL